MSKSMSALAAPTATINHCQRVAARLLGVAVADIVSSRQTKRLAYARHLAMYIARQETGKSMPVIARAFNKKDHTSVVYALQKVKKMARFEDDYKKVKNLLAVEKMNEQARQRAIALTHQSKN